MQDICKQPMETRTDKGFYIFKMGEIKTFIDQYELDKNLGRSGWLSSKRGNILLKQDFKKS